jgi:16S rRNA (adenine1518-N6/adenine1519-N6)-dimethyltransferase
MKAKKSLGQNFLIDQNIINKIINSINVEKEDLIIEIGPGRGALTKLLKTKSANIICYEIDQDLRVYLNALEDNKTKIIYKDFLNANVEDDIKSIKYNNLFVVGNLPYYITTPIIKKIIESNIDAKEMYFMVQEEVANRWTSKPNSKEYGSITLYLNYYFNISKLFKVSKRAFNPIPKVESAIIKFEKRIDKPKVNEEVYFKLVDDCFKMKRKTLKNNLGSDRYNKIEPILIKNGLTPNVRAEELSEDIFVEIANYLR